MNDNVYNYMFPSHFQAILITGLGDLLILYDHSNSPVADTSCLYEGVDKTANKLSVGLSRMTLYMDKASIYNSMF